jgi:MPBQ/MSBQ methyltransferase
MSNKVFANKLAAHYSVPDLVGTFTEVLRSWGKADGPLTPADLASLDHFHFGGAHATSEIGALADVNADTTVLDVGGGFGGPARMLAAAYSCPVTVLDVTEAYCEAGEMLTRRCGLGNLVSFTQGDALAMPFADQTFDRVWTLHSSMNIADKSRLYSEIYRVLRPGGRLVMYENMAGPGGPVHFPVPWARDESISFLRPPSEMRQLLSDGGFSVVSWEDMTDAVVAATLSAPQLTNVVGLRQILGSDFAERARNGIRSLIEHRATLIRAVLTRE